MLGGYSAAIIRDRNLKGVRGGLLGFDGEIATFGHGLNGVEEEVQENLLDLARVDAQREVGVFIGLMDADVVF